MTNIELIELIGIAAFLCAGLEWLYIKSFPKKGKKKTKATAKKSQETYSSIGSIFYSELIQVIEKDIENRTGKTFEVEFTMPTNERWREKILIGADSVLMINSYSVATATHSQYTQTLKHVMHGWKDITMSEFTDSFHDKCTDLAGCIVDAKKRIGVK